MNMNSLKTVDIKSPDGTETSAESKRDDLTSMEMLRAAQAAGVFDFWDDPAEDLYPLKSGAPK